MDPCQKGSYGQGHEVELPLCYTVPQHYPTWLYTFRPHIFTHLRNATTTHEFHCFRILATIHECKPQNTQDGNCVLGHCVKWTAGAQRRAKQYKKWMWLMCSRKDLPQALLTRAHLCHVAWWLLAAPGWLIFITRCSTSLLLHTTVWSSAPLISEELVTV